MNINWNLRIKSPAWWLGLIGCILTPILAYMGLVWTDLTTWDMIGQLFANFFSNPYLIGLVVVDLLAFLGVSADPTTTGYSDSIRALNYTTPSDNVKKG